ncbi:MAG: bifunctional heptose 7-phosphate kinase/heptose 1-phosphate adenyltransferase [Candidatus Hodarchaeales archaeon]
MKVAIVGDSFIDEYVLGEVERISPEAPVPVLDVKKKEERGGGAINVANNLYALGVDLTLFTITDMTKLPYRVVSPKGVTSLRKTRFIGNGFQLLRVDEPKKYLKNDLKRMIYPRNEDFDIIAFVDYDKGIISGGRATIVDSKKKDLSVFKGTKYLKVNEKEYADAQHKEIFEKAFVTKGKHGIDFYEYGEFRFNEPTKARDVVDVTGAGDTVLAAMIYCLVNGWNDPRTMMRVANKAAGIVISKFGTSIVSETELCLKKL